MHFLCQSERLTLSQHFRLLEVCDIVCVVWMCSTVRHDISWHCLSVLYCWKWQKKQTCDMVEMCNYECSKVVEVCDCELQVPPPPHSLVWGFELSTSPRLLVCQHLDLVIYVDTVLESSLIDHAGLPVSTWPSFGPRHPTLSCGPRQQWGHWFLTPS